MSLFNEYKNKNFSFLTKYINRAIYELYEASFEDMKKALVGEEKLTYEDIVDELSNAKDDINDNASIFYTDNNGNLMPISDIPVPIRPTIAERAWLYYYLDKPEARLFLDENLISALKENLRKDNCECLYPLNDQTYSVRELYPQTKYVLSRDNIFKSDIVKTFRTVLKAIHEKKYIITDNRISENKIFQNSVLIPFRFEYRKQTGIICLSAYSSEFKRCIKLNLFKMSNTVMGDAVEDYENFHKLYIESLISGYVKKPVTIKITDSHNGFDRAVHTFSNFRRESYRDEEDNIIMNIFYHKAFEKEIITKLLFLGPAITVLGPENIVKRYVSILRESLNNYRP